MKSTFSRAKWFWFQGLGVGGALGVKSLGFGPLLTWTLKNLCLFKDLYKEIIIRNPKKAGPLGTLNPKPLDPQTLHPKTLNPWSPKLKVKLGLTLTYPNLLFVGSYYKP